MMKHVKALAVLAAIAIVVASGFSRTSGKWSWPTGRVPNPHRID